MIRRLVVVTLALLACHLHPAALHADPIGGALIPPSVAEQFGLHRAWYIQARVSPARVESVYLRMHVSGKQSQTIFQVTDAHGQSYNFSERNLNTFAEPYGVEGAQRAAEEKVQFLKLSGIEATVTQQVVPDITLYISSSTGIVQAADAETGRIRWTAAVGRSDYFTTALDASDDMVGLINGQFLYVLRADDGTVISQRRVVGGVPASGPTILGTGLFVPTLSGQLHAYKFGANEVTWPGVYRSKGTVRFAPTAVGEYIMWPTDDGVISAIDPKRGGAKYRLQVDDPIAGPLVYSPPSQMLAITSAGYLYSFDVNTGGIQWRHSTGDATAEPASVVDDTVYLVSRRAGMRAVSTQTGDEKWWAQGIRHFVAATKERVYAVTDPNVLTALDAASGKLLFQIPLNLKDRAFVNIQTDRIYIGTETGLIQCLHEQGATWPTIHVTGGELAAAAAAKAEAAKQPGGKKPADGESKPTDPFAPAAGDARDPFGGPPAGDKKPAPEPGAPADAKPQPPAKPEANPFEEGNGNAEAPAEADAPADADAPAEADEDSTDQ